MLRIRTDSAALNDGQRAKAAWPTQARRESHRLTRAVAPFSARPSSGQMPASRGLTEHAAAWTGSALSQPSHMFDVGKTSKKMLSHFPGPAESRPEFPDQPKCRNLGSRRQIGRISNDGAHKQCTIPVKKESRYGCHGASNTRAPRRPHRRQGDGLTVRRYAMKKRWGPVYSLPTFATDTPTRKRVSGSNILVILTAYNQ